MKIPKQLLANLLEILKHGSNGEKVAVTRLAALLARNVRRRQRETRGLPRVLSVDARRE